MPLVDVELRYKKKEQRRYTARAGSSIPWAGVSLVYYARVGTVLHGVILWVCLSVCPEIGLSLPVANRFELFNRYSVYMIPGASSLLCHALRRLSCLCLGYNAPKTLGAFIKLTPTP